MSNFDQKMYNWKTFEVSYDWYLYKCEKKCKTKFGSEKMERYRKDT